MIEYVVGFLHDANCVVLIEKKRPEWQFGLLNGVGGHIEDGETPSDAMRREFHEEAGLDIDYWNLGVVLTGKGWRVHFFSARGPAMYARTQTDERVHYVSISSLPGNVIPNLRWLIPLCLCAGVKKPIEMEEKINGR